MAVKVLDHLNLNGKEIRNVLLEIVAGDVASITNGRIWYDSTASRVKRGDGAASHILVETGGDIPAGTIANSALTTNPLARANHTGTQTASTISDFASTAQGYTLNQFASPTADLSINSHKLTNVTDPTSAQDAATKNYVDNAVNGLNWKDSVRVATTANGTLASAFANGQTVDGVVLATGNRILLKNQTTGSENGLYVVAASGAPTRATDADNGTEMLQATVFVEEGTANADTAWLCTNNATITVGSTSLTFVQFGAGATYTAGNGLTLSSNTFSVVAGTGITVGASVAIDTTVVARVKNMTITGDGSTTSFALAHNLGNQYPEVTIWDTTVSPNVMVLGPETRATDGNTTTVVWPSAPANAAVYKVCIVG